MSSEFLGSAVGVFLSLAFSYIPGLAEWFAELSKQQKQATMGLLLIASAVAIFAIQCAGLADYGLICSKAGAVDFVKVLVAALVANQGVYSITKS